MTEKQLIAQIEWARKGIKMLHQLISECDEIMQEITLEQERNKPTPTKYVEDRNAPMPTTQDEPPYEHGF